VPDETWLLFQAQFHLRPIVIVHAELLRQGLLINCPKPHHEYISITIITKAFLDTYPSSVSFGSFQEHPPHSSHLKIGV